ncbi:MAG TPA: hypothetical protein VL173_01065 [Vicinamibacterales bacterium]|nr:hypothetical protein [Vicinamibacterales bacterium]
MNEERRQVSATDRERAAAADDRARVPAAEATPESHTREAPPGRTGSADTPNTRVMLLPGEEADALRSKWTDIQAGFVDAPRSAVERADALVVDTVKQLAHVFGMERARLEDQWDRGGDVTTEDLRVTLQRYRSFFDRLLSM